MIDFPSVRPALAASVVAAIAAAAHAQLMVVDSTADRIMLFSADDGALIDENWLTAAGAVGWAFSTPKEALVVGNEIWVSDQLQDAIHRFSLDRIFLGSITTGFGGVALDNLRGIGTDGSVVLLATDGGSVMNTITVFDVNGVATGSFTTNTSSPFDAEFFQGDILVSDFVSSGALERHSVAGVYLGDFATAIADPQQIVVQEDGSVITVGSIGSSGTEGIFHFNSDGSLRLYIDTTVSGPDQPRGARLLGNGNYLISSSDGVFVATPDGVFSQVGTAGGQYIGVLAPPVDDDLRMTVAESADPVSLSDDLTYTVRVRNGGSTTLTNVSATVTLSGLTSIVSSTAGFHDGSPTGGVHTATFASIAPLTTETYEITVSPNGAGTAMATFAATADQTDPDPANNSGSVETVFDTLVDLSVTIQDSPDPVNEAAGEINYNILVTNSGPEDATNVVLTVALPPQSTFALASAGMHDGSPTGGTVTATFPTIINGFSEGVSVRVITSANGEYTATASVVGDGADPTPDDATASTTTTVDVSADVSVALSDLVDPMVAVGSANTYTMTITNAGPTTATDVSWTLALPFEMSFASASAGIHDGSASGGSVSGTVASLAVGSSEIITVEVTANALAETATASASAFPTQPADPDSSDNNAQVVTRIVADGSGFGTVILSDTGFSSLPTTVAPGTGGRLIESFERPFLSPDGTKYVLSVNVDGDTPNDEVVLAWDGAQFVNVLQEATTAFPDLFDLAGVIDLTLDINDAGVTAFTTNTSATVSDEVAATVDLAGNVTVVAREDNAVPGTAFFYGATIDSPQIDNLGNVYFSADTTDGTDFDEYIVRTADGVTATVLFQEGVTVPANQDGGFTFAWDNFNVNDFMVTGDGLHTLLQGDTEDLADFDAILAYDNSVVVQEGVVFDPLSFASPVTSITNSFLAENGDWYAVVSNDDGEEFVAKNGAVIARDFDELFPGSIFFWDDFLSVVGDRNGNYVINGSSDDADTQQDGVLVLNGERIIARENDPIDVDGNGLFDDNTFISSFAAQDQVITSDGRLITPVLTRGTTGELLLSFDLGLGGAVCICEADGNAAQVNVFDLLAYLDLWFAQAAGADIDGTPGVNVFDLLFFLDCWFPASAGSPCP